MVRAPRGCDAALVHVTEAQDDRQHHHPVEPVPDHPDRRPRLPDARRPRAAGARRRAPRRLHLVSVLAARSGTDQRYRKAPQRPVRRRNATTANRTNAISGPRVTARTAISATRAIVTAMAVHTTSRANPGNRRAANPAMPATRTPVWRRRDRAARLLSGGSGRSRMRRWSSSRVTAA